MSKHSLPARGADLPFSHKSVVSISPKQNNISSKTRLCSQLFAGHVVSSANEKKGKNPSNDNSRYYPTALRRVQITPKTSTNMKGHL